MSKIAIVSNAEEGVVIDISGCDSPAEAKQYLASTLQVSSRFWEGLTVDLNLGNLSLTAREVEELLSIVREAGVDPTRVLSADVSTVAALYQVTRKDSDLNEGNIEKPVDGIVVAEMAHGIQSPADDARCCDELPALSVEGQTLQISNLTVAHADFFEQVASATGSTTDHSPSSQGSHLNKTGERASGGNRPTQVTFGAGTVVEVLERMVEEPAAVKTEIANPRELVAVTGVNPVAVPPAVTVATPSFAAPSFAASTASIQSPAPILVVPVTPGQAPVSPTVSTAKASSAPGTKTLHRNSAERSVGVLYLRQTLRSGQAVTHKGDLVIIGDVNPGAEVSAEGDITIWGALRGVAHAGITGNATAEIRALKFDPIQLRIAHAIARAPDRSKAGFHGSSGPETARIVDGKIRISCSDPD
ncbi:MAG: hypothetical protein K2W95_12460 [Candidatus Obscuribacterales bacterium]|nr:hypothetical protein [Candidatus Obscuribacterales bacterium]